MRQAQHVAALIAERPALVAVSRFLRTFQTAEPLLNRYPGVPVEEWRIEEFTYLNISACAGTSYAERECLRRAYWTRNDPLWVDGPGCECFSDFVARVREFESALSLRGAGETVAAFTHGLVIQALLWLQRHTSREITSAGMADFDTFRQSVSVPNCAILRASPNGNGSLRLPETLIVAHPPAGTG